MPRPFPCGVEIVEDADQGPFATRVDVVSIQLGLKGEVLSHMLSLQHLLSDSRTVEMPHDRQHFLFVQLR